ncbi:MAG: hypothetical protein IT366_12520 [Candidatus Hydrogenedentes bacterium]|nr:hypothetical protein [Candidatus Hydrogenedentota bacterium]
MLKPYSYTRREFLRRSAVVSAVYAGAYAAEPETASPRTYQICFAPQILDNNPDLLQIVADAGVSTIWLAGFFYGYWPAPIDHVMEWRDRIEKMGLAAHVVNVPLGHPGDSLGAKDGSFPLSPPSHWKLALRPDGSTYAGTSLHEPATEENVKAMQELNARGVKRVFLDDDFRLAIGPGTIGGCFCDAHKKQFMERGGYNDSQWQELLDAVRTRTLSPILRVWVDFTCDQLTASFRAMQAAAPNIELGNMVMYLGAEKAGIRLSDYSNALLRVGELMFDDKSFAPVKGKTDELFSVLFHRRFVAPERAFSETTAFPSDKLSAANMAAKLTISTIADVRNTTYMSGVTPFPFTHWETLVSAMKLQASMHAAIAGQTPRGPLKHFWGEASRYVGDDKPFSLFLAMGVPFEITDTPANDGWTFLSDADAKSLENLSTPGTKLLCRPGAANRIEGVDETLEALFAWRRGVLPSLKNVPYIEDEKPVICAWYPSIRTALIWNPAESRENFSLRYGDSTRDVTLGPLESTLLTSL